MQVSNRIGEKIPSSVSGQPTAFDPHQAVANDTKVTNITSVSGRVLLTVHEDVATGALRVVADPSLNTTQIVVILKKFDAVRFENLMPVQINGAINTNVPVGSNNNVLTFPAVRNPHFSWSSSPQSEALLREETQKQLVNSSRGYDNHAPILTTERTELSLGLGGPERAAAVLDQEATLATDKAAITSKQKPLIPYAPIPGESLSDFFERVAAPHGVSWGAFLEANRLFLRNNFPTDLFVDRAYVTIYEQGLAGHVEWLPNAWQTSAHKRGAFVTPDEAQNFIPNDQALDYWLVPLKTVPADYAGKNWNQMISKATNDRDAAWTKILAQGAITITPQERQARRSFALNQRYEEGLADLGWTGSLIAFMEPGAVSAALGRAVSPGEILAMIGSGKFAGAARGGQNPSIVIASTKPFVYAGTTYPAGTQIRIETQRMANGSAVVDGKTQTSYRDVPTRTTILTNSALGTEITFNPNAVTFVDNATTQTTQQGGAANNKTPALPSGQNLPVQSNQTLTAGAGGNKPSGGGNGGGIAVPIPQTGQSLEEVTRPPHDINARKKDALQFIINELRAKGDAVSTAEANALQAQLNRGDFSALQRPEYRVRNEINSSKFSIQWAGQPQNITLSGLETFKQNTVSAVQGANYVTGTNGSTLADRLNNPNTLVLAADPARSLYFTMSREGLDDAAALQEAKRQMAQLQDVLKTFETYFSDPQNYQEPDVAAGHNNLIAQLQSVRDGVPVLIDLRIINEAPQSFTLQDIESARQNILNIMMSKGTDNQEYRDALRRMELINRAMSLGIPYENIRLQNGIFETQNDPYDQINVCLNAGVMNENGVATPGALLLHEMKHILDMRRMRALSLTPEFQNALKAHDLGAIRRMTAALFGISENHVYFSSPSFFEQKARTSGQPTPSHSPYTYVPSAAGSSWAVHFSVDHLIDHETITVNFENRFQNYLNQNGYSIPARSEYWNGSDGIYIIEKPFGAPLAETPSFSRNPFGFRSLGEYEARIKALLGEINSAHTESDFGALQGKLDEARRVLEGMKTRMVEGNIATYQGFPREDYLFLMGDDVEKAGQHLDEVIRLKDEMAAQAKPAGASGSRQPIRDMGNIAAFDISGAGVKELMKLYLFNQHSKALNGTIGEKAVTALKLLASHTKDELIRNSRIKKYGDNPYLAGRINTEITFGYGAYLDGTNYRIGFDFTPDGKVIIRFFGTYH